jgi:endonuclease/exonuclease/phosphatase family metal-dependent hydrolase
VFRLLSWNVLADAYIRPKFYPRTPAALLAPGARTAAIVEYLTASDADVACLQEVEPAIIEALERAGGWAVRTAMKRDKPDGCAILTRRGAGAAVMLDALRMIEYSDGAPDRADSGHVAMIASLRAGAAAFTLATTHLRWDPPATPREQRWAVRQAGQLVRELGPLDTAIVCGDLNVEPTDEAYALLLDAGLVDPAATALVPTANPNGRAKRIDHILVGRAVAARVLPVEPVADATPLPSEVMPSDHVPIGVAVAT